MRMEGRREEKRGRKSDVKGKKGSGSGCDLKQRSGSWLLAIETRKNSMYPCLYKYVL